MKTLLKISFFATVVFTAVVAYAYFNSNIEPNVWQPSANKGLTGDFAQNNKLAIAERMVEGVGVGPEDVAKGNDGWFYTGFHDGRIIRFNEAGRHEEFVNTGGRPLGLQFDKQGNLIVADSYKGLISIAKDKTITVLVDSVDGKKMTFVDDLDIAEDGTIWFSDATMRHYQETYIYDLIEARPTGRLLSYSPATGETTVHMNKLFFANGVALGPNDEFVLINETGASQIHRLWLKGEKQGMRDVFISGLPAMPDNLSFNGSDTFWVALPALRVPDLEGLSGDTFTRRILGALPPSILNALGGSYGMFIGLDLDGNVKYNLQDSSGKYAVVTSVNEYGGKLYLGSIKMDAVATLAAPRD